MEDYRDLAEHPRLSADGEDIESDQEATVTALISWRELFRFRAVWAMVLGVPLTGAAVYAYLLPPVKRLRLD